MIWCYQTSLIPLQSEKSNVTLTTIDFQILCWETLSHPKIPPVLYPDLWLLFFFWGGREGFCHYMRGSCSCTNIFQVLHFILLLHCCCCLVIWLLHTVKDSTLLSKAEMAPTLPLPGAWTTKPFVHFCPCCKHAWRAYLFLPRGLNSHVYCSLPRVWGR